MRRLVVLALVSLLIAAPAQGQVRPAERDTDPRTEQRGSVVGEHSVFLPGVPPEALGRDPGGVDAADAHISAQARTLAQVLAGEFMPGECFTSLPEGVVPGEDVDCGFVGTPLRHDDADGQTIDLAVVVVRAREQATEPPLVFLAGGPGERLVANFTPLLASPDSFLAPLTANRDVVLFDQRGAGDSRPALDCPEVFATFVAGAPIEAVVAAYAACSDRLTSQGVDLAAYNTAQNARDLDVIRRALGYDRWDVYGTSYGTLLALQAVKLQPAGAREPIRTLTLSSPIPLDENFVVDAGPSVQQALERTADACAEDPSCADTVDFESDGLLGAADRVTARLREDPQSFGVVVADSETQEATTVPVTVDPATFTGLLFSLYYATPFIPQVPGLVDDAEEGRYEALVRGVGAATPTTGGASLGMQMSFLCAEQAATSSPADVRDSFDDLSLTVRTLIELQPVAGLPLYEICGQWDTEPAPDELREPANTDVPGLVVTGRLDQITPPQYGDQLATDDANRYLVEVPGAGHSPLLALGPCGVGIQLAFLADPDSRPDTSCAQELTFGAGPQLPLGPPVASRIAGPDRYATAAAQAEIAFPDGADAAILASGEAFPDGLVAAALAGALEAPVLLTERGALPQVTAQALAELDPDRVVVVGGPDAITDDVVAEVGAGFDVERVGGQDRYATAAAIASRIPSDRIGKLAGLRTAFVASGATFPDALSAGPLAAMGRHPILLVTPGGLPDATVAALGDLGIERVVILGDTAAVSADVEAQLEQVTGTPPLRLGGPNRYATAARVADAASSLFGLDSRAVLLARGDVFADALAAGPHGAQLDAPVLLARPDALPAAAAAELRSRAGTVDIVRALGSPRALADETVLAAALATAPAPPAAP